MDNDTRGMTPVSKIDVLEQDTEIRGQKFVCLSFVSPEDVLIAKEPFMFNKFTTHFAKEMTDMFGNLKEYFKDNTTVLETLNLVRERYEYVCNDTGIQREFEFFKEKNNASLETEFLERNSFKTTIRGIKVRGSYETFDEAKARVEAIRKVDTNFNVYVAQVGCWCPWSPYPNALQDQEYAETSLNTLVKAYVENEEQKGSVYNNRKEEMMEKIKRDMDERKDLWLAAKKKELEERGPQIVEEIPTGTPAAVESVDTPVVESVDTPVVETVETPAVETVEP